MKKLLAWLFTFVLLMALAGCTESPAAPEITPVPTSSAAPVTPEAELEADWTLHVNQTITVESEGLPVNHTLILVAKKTGGTDIYGSYEGLAYVRTQLDASVLSNEVLAVSGGFNIEYSSDTIQFDILPYDADSFFAEMPTDSADVLTIAPLAEFNGMALLAPEMQGSGVINPLVQGIQGERAEYNTSTSDVVVMPMRIGVSNAEVYVEIPSLKTGQMFQGMLTGDPAQGEDLLEQTRELIEAQNKDANTSEQG